MSAPVSETATAALQEPETPIEAPRGGKTPWWANQRIGLLILVVALSALFGVLRPAFFNRICEELPSYWQRLVVRPGVTGFAQTRITREDSWEDKLIHDLEYIADRSIRLYLRVLGATMTRIISLTLRGRDR